VRFTVCPRPVRPCKSDYNCDICQDKQQGSKTTGGGFGQAGFLMSLTSLGLYVLKKVLELTKNMWFLRIFEKAALREEFLEGPR